MKETLLSISLFILSASIYGQEAEVILKQTYKKCHSVQNGTYSMTRHMKYMSDSDTTIQRYECSFKKLPSDTVFYSAFDSRTYWNDTSFSNVIYTGDEFVMLNKKDSSATIMSNTIWAERIKSLAHNYKFYMPLTQKESTPIPNDSNLADTQREYRLIGIEQVNGVECYHIQVKITPQDEEDDPMKTLRQEYDFWINRDDFIPIQYDVAFDLVMNNDNMYQYERTILTKYELNALKDESGFTMNTIPEYYKLKDYVPYKSPELLPLDTIAPLWELYSLNDEKVNLDSLKGKLVLVDFFYKSCYPCMLALPSLQAINEK